MRRDVRKTSNKGDDLNEKIIKYSGIGVAILAVIILALLIYSKNLNDEVKEGTLSSEQIASIMSNSTETENTTSASTDIGKSVNEATNQMTNDITNNASSKTTSNTTQNKVTTNTTNTTETSTTSKNKNNIVENNIDNQAAETKSIELSFQSPVEGEIVKDFAIDNLMYSETLQEWTTHTGVDIKADKTTVVKAAEAGTVKTIKNDPRYGLTIVIEHENGFQTVYSNLLTSEFVVEGEKVQKGQSLGTVGNTAAFEIADQPHLHFEIIKDSTQVDPTIYLK